jgi:hypothetical protein
MMRVATWSASLLIALTLLACGGDETDPEAGHTPNDARLFVAGVDVTGGLQLSTNETVRVEVRFIDADEQPITGIEDEHHTALSFLPDDLATTESVEGANFQKDVIASATPGVGSVMVGYGHDEAADELEFGPFNVVVAASGPPNPQAAP